MKRFLILLFFIPQLLLGQSGLIATNWVNDYVNILTYNSQEVHLNSLISNFEQQTDIEMSFALVDTLNGRDIESFSNELFKTWGVGKADRNNGLLIVIAPNERKWRIEIGYGLEAYLTDGQSQVFGNSNFRPNFKEGNYFKGINNFVSEVTTHLGTSSWEDRVAYTQKLEQESREFWSNFWWNTLYVIIGIFSLIIFIFLFVRFKRKIEAQRKFASDKIRLIESYNREVDSVNRDLKRFNFLPVVANSTLISSSKDASSLTLNYNSSLHALDSSKRLYTLAVSLSSKISEMKRVYAEVSSKERELNIPVTSSKDITMGNTIQSLNQSLESTNRELSYLNDRVNILRQFEKFTVMGQLNTDVVDRNVESLNKRFESEQYKLNDISRYATSLKSCYQGFNSVDKNFNNFVKIQSAYQMIKSAQSNMNNYVESVEKMNQNHRHMVSTLNNVGTSLNSQNDRLSKYLTKSDVSSSTKTAIKTFILTLLAFKATSDLLSSYNAYCNLIDQSDRLVKKAESDIDAEETKRRRQKEEEDRARRRREEESRRSTYYPSTSSNDSSSGSSSWGGFGGGDSGGGGSSGDW